MTLVEDGNSREGLRFVKLWNVNLLHFSGPYLNTGHAYLN